MLLPQRGDVRSTVFAMYFVSFKVSTLVLPGKLRAQLCFARFASDITWR
jgi:hypothetical protein